MTPKLKKILIIAYIVIFTAGAIFVATVLKTQNVQVLSRDPEKQVEDVKPVKVTLQVIDGNTSSYVYTMKNMDNVNELLSTIRDDKKIYYEQTQYTNKITIDIVNATKSTEQRSWRVFKNNVDITDQMMDLRLSDNDTFVLKMTNIEK